MKHMDEAARAQAAGKGEAAETPAGLDLERLQRELDEDPTLQAILEEVRRGAAAQLLEGQLAAIGRLDPRVRCAEDLVKLPCFAAFDELVRGGLDMVNAYKLANFDELTDRRSRAGYAADPGQTVSSEQGHPAAGTGAGRGGSRRDRQSHRLGQRPPGRRSDHHRPGGRLHGGSVVLQR